MILPRLTPGTRRTLARWTAQGRGALVVSALALALGGAPRAGGLADREPDDQSGEGPAQAISTSSGTDTPEMRAARRALDAGLAYLALRQRSMADGSFPIETPDEARENAPVGVTALAALAFMAAGNSPGRGPFGHELGRAVDYLLDRTDLAPESPTRGYVSTLNDKSRTHGHGFATLVLAEAHGMSPGRYARVERSLEAAVRLIERSQGTEGGWEYEPRAVARHEGSVTVCLVQSLRAARNSGLKVDGGVIQRAEDYVVRLQKEDGTFRYELGDPRSSIALTAAAISTLNMAGRYDDRIVQNAIDAVTRGLAEEESGSGHAQVQFPYYRRLYIAQAFWQLADTSLFDDWYARELPRILRSQEDDGSWRDRTYGDCYATAINCLVLALPEGLLPIFQR